MEWKTVIQKREKQNTEESQTVTVPSLDVVETERDRLIRRKEIRANIIRMCGVLVVIAAIAVLVATKFLPVLKMSGSSMEPTLTEGEIIVLTKTDNPQKGDIIAFYYENKILIKRVIGTPGDYVDIKDDGTVLVNGEVLEETYITETSIGDCDIMLPCHIKDNEFFVLGDCRSNSMDSRNSAIGCVSKEQILGKAISIIWPFESAGSIQ